MPSAPGAIVAAAASSCFSPSPPVIRWSQRTRLPLVAMQPLGSQ